MAWLIIQVYIPASCYYNKAFALRLFHPISNFGTIMFFMNCLLFVVLHLLYVSHYFIISVTMYAFVHFVVIYVLLQQVLLLMLPVHYTIVTVYIGLWLLWLPLAMEATQLLMYKRWSMQLQLCFMVNCCLVSFWEALANLETQRVMFEKKNECHKGNLYLHFVL